MTFPSTKELLAQGASGATAKFDTLGRSYAGTVVGASVRQATDFDDNTPKVWPDGNPVLQLVITLATNERDPQTVDDDGHRNVYVRWYGTTRNNLQAAVQAAGVDDIEPGGHLTATFAQEIPSKKGNPAKVLDFVYRPPSATRSLLADSNGNGSPAAAQPKPAPVQPTPPQAPPAASALPIEQIRQLGQAGLTAEQIGTALGGLDPNVVQALLNTVG